MRDKGLLLWRQGQRPVDTRQHEGTISVLESNTRWCSDALEVSCDNGERVRIAFALDCCDREAMSWVATTKGIDAGLVGDLMMQAVERRFGQIFNTVRRVPEIELSNNHDVPRSV